VSAPGGRRHASASGDRVGQGRRSVVARRRSAAECTSRRIGRSRVRVQPRLQLPRYAATATYIAEAVERARSGRFAAVLNRRHRPASLKNAQVAVGHRLNSTQTYNTALPHRLRLRFPFHARYNRTRRPSGPMARSQLIAGETPSSACLGDGTTDPPRRDQRYVRDLDHLGAL
jgi:hypothetical protein